MTYAPPTALNRPSGLRVGSVGAAAALDLLACDASSLVSTSPPPGRSRGDKSAAKLAREHYEAELQRRMQVPVDLIDLGESPPARSASSSSSPPAPFASVAPGGASAPTGTSASTGDLLGDIAFNCSESDFGSVQMAPPAGPPVDPDTVFRDGGSSNVGLWPGEVVLARCSANGGFYRARVIRVYSSRGKSFADVEWIRPQANPSAFTQCQQEFLCRDLGGSPDETSRTHGLQVDVDIRRAGVASTTPRAQRIGATDSVEVSPAASAVSSGEGSGAVHRIDKTAALPDLLDL